MKILLADDEQLILEPIRRRLVALGYDVVSAHDGAQAKAEIESGEPYDLLIVDVRMPGLDGLALLRHGKKARPETEVVVMTGYADVSTAVAALEGGAFAYLRKPFCVEELLQVIERCRERLEMRRKEKRYIRQIEGVVKELRSSEERYRTLVEGIDGAVISTDGNLIICAASERCREVLGRAPEELLGTPIDALRREEEAAAFRHQAEELLRQASGAVRREGWLLRPDGTCLHTVEVITPFGGGTGPGEQTGIFWIVKDASAEQELKREAEIAREHLDSVRRSRSGDRRIVGESEAIRGVLRMIRSVAGTTASVLVCGETGTGKELVAESIHVNSRRREKPFVVVNCAALQDTLLESELFGYRRGAFTGAVGDKRGLVEIADGGTLFVDEVAEMSPAIQAKMLRVLEQGQFRWLGCTEDRETDLRVIAATNRDLAKGVRAGTFREDLFYRLDVVRVLVPPLRERKEDIPVLAEHFLHRAEPTAGAPKRFTPAALDALMAYDWPGNVRELANVVERAVILSGERGRIDVQHLSLTPGDLTAPVRTLKTLAEREMDKALALANGNKTRAAKMLGISRQTLISRLKRRREAPPGRAARPARPAQS